MDTCTKWKHIVQCEEGVLVFDKEKAVDECFPEESNNDEVLFETQTAGWVCSCLYGCGYLFFCFCSGGGYDGAGTADGGITVGAGWDQSGDSLSE